MSYLSVFLVRLGAPNWLVGLYTSLPALVSILVVLPMGAFVQRQANLIRTVNGARLVFRAVIGAFALLPFLPTNVAPYVLVGARSLLSIPGAAINVAQTTILGSATTPERRPRMLSMRWALSGLASAGVGFIAGQWLDKVSYPLNYQVLFLSAFLAGIGSVLNLRRLRLPDRQIKSGPRPKVGLGQMIALIRGAPEFRRFAIAAFVFRMGMYLPMALYAIYRVRVLGSSDAWIGILLTVERLLSMISYILLGRLTARPAFRRRLWIACVGISLYPLTTALAVTPEMLLIPSAMLGIFGPGMNIFLTNTLFQVSPEDERPSFVAANSFLANVTAFASPLLGTFLADLVGIRLALVVAFVLRFAGGFSFVALKPGKEPHS